MQIFKSINRLFSVLLLLCKTCIFIKMLNMCPNYSKYCIQKLKRQEKNMYSQ